MLWGHSSSVECIVNARRGQVCGPPEERKKALNHLSTQTSANMETVHASDSLIRGLHAQEISKVPSLPPTVLSVEPGRQGERTGDKMDYETMMMWWWWDPEGKPQNRSDLSSSIYTHVLITRRVNDCVDKAPHRQDHEAYLICFKERPLGQNHWHHVST